MDIKFNEKGLVPAVAQDVYTGEVLMLAYMNEESIAKTKETGLATYFSRSRNEIWVKGETSGHYQHVVKMLTDCDSDTILLLVKQDGAACHTGNKTCFYRDIDGNSAEGFVHPLNNLYNTVAERLENPVDGSYTNYLFEKGIDKILKKVGEECTETVIAAKNNSKEEIQYETADLFYHLAVMLADRGLSFDDIMAELERRRK